MVQASKAAIAQFFETLRVEFGPDIGITLVTPGFVESELTQGKFLNREGKLVVDQEMRDVSVVCFRPMNWKMDSLNEFYQDIYTFIYMV